MRTEACRNGRLTYQSLEVLDGASEVDTSHAFDEDLQFLALLDGRKGECLFVLHTINLAHVLAVDENLCEVVGFKGKYRLAHRKVSTLLGNLRQASGI